MTQSTKLTAMRRKERRMSDTAEVHSLLARGDVGYLGTASAGQPFVTPLSYFFDGERIYFHGAHHGRAKENMRQNPRVCFTVAERGRYLPSKRAMDFGVEYDGVMVFGTVRWVEDEAEKLLALNGLLEKYFPHLKGDEDYRAIVPAELPPTAVFAIEIEEMSGKRKAAPDHNLTGKLRAFHSLDEVA